MRDRRRTSDEDSHLATGWLYADLLLALVVVFLSAIPGVPIKNLFVDGPGAGNDDEMIYTTPAAMESNGTPESETDGSVIPGGEQPTSLPTETATPTPSPTLTPEPTAVPVVVVTPSPIGLSPVAQCFDISIDQSAFLNGSQEAEASVLQQIKSVLPNTLDTPAGMVIVWARGELGPSLVTASRVNELLRSQLGNSFGAAATKSLYFPGSPDMARIEVYFYTDRPWVSLFAQSCP